MVYPMVKSVDAVVFPFNSAASDGANFIVSYVVNS